MNNEEFLDYVEKVYAFHTKRAPGIPIAVEMVFRCLSYLGESQKLCAIAETRTCLPDAIQFVAGCTLGNGNLKILDSIGRYAMTFYNRKDGKGVRIYVDLNKIDKEKSSELYKFFLRKRSEEVRNFGPERKVSNAQVVKEFIETNRDIFSMEDVIVKDTKKLPILECGVCGKCGESFTKSSPDEKLCSVCSGELQYYSKLQVKS